MQGKNEERRMAEDMSEVLQRIYSEFGEFCRDRGRVSEADTRANILDRLIHELLDWPRTCVRRETAVHKGFLDYELSIVRPIIVLEAKAAGEAFSLPYRKSVRARRMKVSGLVKNVQGGGEAIEQAQRYAVEKGIRYAVASNGYSFIVFRALVEGSGWRDANAIVFESPKVIGTDLATFVNALSYNAVHDGQLDELFRPDAYTLRETSRPIESIVNADATYGRNPINHALQPYVERFFGDIAAQENRDLLEHCYVHSWPIQHIDKELRLFIEDTVPTFIGNATQITTGEHDQGGQLERDLRSQLAANQHHPRAVVLMGGIGSGKTTFLKRFFRVVVPDLLFPRGPAVLVYLDLLGAPDHPETLDKFVWSGVNRELALQLPELLDRSTLDSVFSEETVHLRSILSKDPRRLAERMDERLLELIADRTVAPSCVLRHLRRTGRMPVIVFDNVDQLRAESQTQVFTTAQTCVNHLGAIALVVLREESFSAAILQRHLTAYSITRYHLSSPRFSKLIGARLDFAARSAAAEPPSALSTGSGPAGSVQVLEFLHALRRSVFEKNRNIVRLVESVSFGNMRLALDLFNSFITSGATDLPKILSIVQRHKSYSIPFHEFAKSVILGDYRYYREARSPILNLFDVSHERNCSHFTTLRLLRYLELGHGKIGGAQDFLNLREMTNAMVDTFDNEGDVRRTVLRLIARNRQLVELDTRLTESLEGASGIRITSSGRYYLEYFASAFAYLDLVWHDTPIASSSVSDQLGRLIGEVAMRKRFERVDLFLEYLRGEERQEVERLGLSADSPGFWGPFVPKIVDQVATEKQFITRKVVKAKETVGDTGEA